MNSDQILMAIRAIDYIADGEQNIVLKDFAVDILMGDSKEEDAYPRLGISEKYGENCIGKVGNINLFKGETNGPSNM